MPQSTRTHSRLQLARRLRRGRRRSRCSRFVGRRSGRTAHVAVAGNFGPTGGAATADFVGAAAHDTWMAVSLGHIQPVVTLVYRHLLDQTLVLGSR